MKFPPTCTGLRRSSRATPRSRAGVESTEGITEFDKLPKAAQEYLVFQERESGAKIGMVSTGPDRGQTMVLPEFAAELSAITS